jgi:hypothetical protein
MYYANVAGAIAFALSKGTTSMKAKDGKTFTSDAIH